MVPLHLLSSLAAEGLSPPLFTHSHDPEAWQLLTHEETDSEDPKWCSLFTKYFLLPSSSAITQTSVTTTVPGESFHDESDDLLFFVRDRCPKDGTAQRTDLATEGDGKGLHENKKDPVFVRRRLPGPNPMPSLDDLVHWKETFFLNLICQLPCKLTVAVCQRQASSAGEEGKTTMVCPSNIVTRRVYALPSRSRVVGNSVRAKLVGPGGTGWECSYPMIHYVVDDYEDVFEDVVLNKGEHLCVELSVTVTPPSSSSIPDGKDKGMGESCESRGVGKNDDSQSLLKTFPPFAPPGTKITLFQGAAPHSALHKTYVHKVGDSFTRRFRMSQSSTEYVMMRGPGGKGSAQVAITAAPTQIMSSESDVPHLRENGDISSSAASPHPFPKDSSSSRKSPLTSNPPKPVTAGSIFSNLKHLALSALSGDRASTDQESIRCCLTFVNVSWTHIANDIISYETMFATPV